MFKIIVSGHGEFASSIEKTLDYIIGPQENVVFINFNNNMGTSELELAYNQHLSTITDEGILFLTDLIGGTPFSTAVTVSDGLNNVGVIGGINIPTILAALEYRESGYSEKTLDEILNFGKTSLMKFEKKELNTNKDDDNGI